MLKSLRRLSLALLSILTITTYAADWNKQWIRHPYSGNNAQVWFRGSYKAEGPIAEAKISVATSGRYILYVNERIVSRDILLPYNPGHSQQPVVMDFEVQRFMRPDSNVIALWYSPDPESGYTEDRQIAVDFYGEYDDGRRFSYSSDSTWLCKQANGGFSLNGDEIIDARKYLDGWKSPSIRQSDWTKAEVTAAGTKTMTYAAPVHSSWHIDHIYDYVSVDVTDNGITYDFGRNIEGWARLTLRNMSTGDTLDINGFKYVCRGETDEQAFNRFSTIHCGYITIKGPKKFSRKNIMKIEAIDIREYLNKSYLY